MGTPGLGLMCRAPGRWLIAHSSSGRASSTRSASSASSARTCAVDTSVLAPPAPGQVLASMGCARAGWGGPLAPLLSWWSLTLCSSRFSVPGRGARRIG